MTPEERRAYNRERYIKNKDKILDYAKKYYQERKADKPPCTTSKVISHYIIKDNIDFKILYFN